MSVISSSLSPLHSSLAFVYFSEASVAFFILYLEILVPIKERQGEGQGGREREVCAIMGILHVGQHLQFIFLCVWFFFYSFVILKTLAAAQEL